MKREELQQQKIDSKNLLKKLKAAEKPPCTTVIIGGAEFRTSKCIDPEKYRNHIQQRIDENRYRIITSKD